MRRWPPRRLPDATLRTCARRRTLSLAGTRALCRTLALLACVSTLVGAVALQPLGAAGTREPGFTAEPGHQDLPPGEGFPMTVVDDAGIPVVVKRKPQRIVSLTIFTDEILLDLVGLDRLIGVTVFSQDPEISNVLEQAAKVQYKLQLNVELIVSLRPDLVFVANWTDASEVAQLRGSGIPVFLLSTGTRVEEIESKILTIARLVGETEQGLKVVGSMEARLADIDGRIAAIPAGKRLTVLDYNTWGSAQGRGSSWDEVVRRAGLINAAGGFEADDWGQVTLSRETLLSLDPDLLILPGWVYGTPAGSRSFYESIVGDPALQSLRAIREGKVYRMPEGLRAAASQYIVDAIGYLASLAYPELWEK